MHLGRSLTRAALGLSYFNAMASAWPDLFPRLDTLVVRANNDPPAPAAVPTDTSASATGTSTPTGSSTGSSSASETAAASSSSSDSSSSSESDNTHNLNTAHPKPTKSPGKDSGNSTETATGDDSETDTSSSETTFNIIDPAANVQMRTPATAVPIGTALYKISDYVTFGWNYTNMQGTPTAIDVLVTCSTSSSLWTLTQNMTFQTSVAYVWDTSEQANDIQQPLLTAVYTLIIKDSDVGINAKPRPGYLGSFTGFTFGLYARQKYVPFPEFHCLDCNAGPGGFDSSAIRLALAMCAVTVFSFTWFVAGLS